MGKLGKPFATFEDYDFLGQKIKFTQHIMVSVTLDKFRGLSSGVTVLNNTEYGHHMISITFDENPALVNKEQFDKLLGECMKAFPKLQLQGKNNEFILLVTQKLDEARKAFNKAAAILSKY